MKVKHFDQIIAAMEGAELYFAAHPGSRRRCGGRNFGSGRAHGLRFSAGIFRRASSVLE